MNNKYKRSNKKQPARPLPLRSSGLVWLYLLFLLHCCHCHRLLVVACDCVACLPLFYCLVCCCCLLAFCLLLPLLAMLLLACCCFAYCCCCCLLVVCLLAVLLFNLLARFCSLASTSLVRYAHSLVILFNLNHKAKKSQTKKRLALSPALYLGEEEKMK